MTGVKELDWEDYPADDGPVISKAITPFGTYFIVDDTDDFTGWYLELISHDNAKWWQHVRSTATHFDVSGYQMDDMEPLKSVAQNDFEKRVLALLQ